MQAVRLRCAAALVAALLAGLLLQADGLLPALAASAVSEAADRSVEAVEATVDVVAPPAVTSGHGTPTWQWTTIVRSAVLGLAAVAALLAAHRSAHAGAQPVAAWRLVRPDQRPATVRHRSPLAARRAPPAPARR